MQNILKYMSQSMLDTENILQNILHVELEYAKYAKQNMHKVCKTKCKICNKICNKYAIYMQYIYNNSKMIIFGEIRIICKTNRPNQQYSSWRIKSQYAEYALPALLMVE